MYRIALTNRIATKMIMALLVVIMIPTLSISFAYYMTASSIVRENVRSSSMQLARQAADSLSGIFNVGSDTSDLIYSDVRLQHFVLNETKDASPETSFAANTYIDSMLNNIVFASSFVKIVYILRQEGDSWGSGVFSQNKLDRYMLSDFPWIQEAERLDGKLAWTYLQDDKFSGAGDNNDIVIPVVRVLKDFRNLRNIGYLMVNIDGKSVLDKISQLRLGRTGSFFVIDANGRIMIHPNAALIGRDAANADLNQHLLRANETEFTYEQDGQPYYGVKQPLSNGWSIVGVVPVKEITGQLDRLRQSVLTWGIGFSLLAIAIGLFIARKITRPIRDLTGQMKLVEEGDLGVRTNVRSSDEIGLMSKQFNRMVSRVNRLMRQVQEEQSQKQKAELRAVQHRINPHFMYNTLGTIKWLIKFGDYEKAYEGISAFTRLIEANMGRKGMMVTIGEELSVIREYLPILQLRYSLRFDLRISVSRESLASFVIPRMLLQPLVENAIFHGIVPCGKDGGTISIDIESAESGVTIRVSDDGLGMKQETAAGLRESAGIGMKHVFECVQLYFAQGSDVVVDSAPGEGTVVELRLISREPAADETA